MRTRTVHSGNGPDRLAVALWHEVGRHVADDITTTVFRTTPIGVLRPTRGTTDAEVTCRVCRAPVPVRVVDGATARRRRLYGTTLRWGQYLLAPALLCTVAMTLASMGLRLGSGLPAVLGWLVVVLPVMLSVLWLAEWAERRADGVTILRPGDATHRVGPHRSAVVTLPTLPM